LFGKVERVVERVRLLFPLGLAQVLDVLTYVLVGLQHAQAEETLLSDALIDNLLPLLESQAPAMHEALACLLDGSIAGWIAAFVRDQSDYRPDPERARVAAALLGRSLGRDESWQEAFAGRVASQGEGEALEYADALTKALRRLAEERHG
jgi:hypothetical protein